MRTRRSPPLFLVALLAVACAESRPPDCLLVTVDTLRSDFLSCYGYPRLATPRIDALAEAGALFEQHYTTIATTAPAHATLLTGLYPREHGLLRNGPPLDPDVPYLPEFLQEAGYRTGASIGARVLASRAGFARGFEFFDEDFGESVLKPGGRNAKYERFATSVVDRALEFLERDDGRPTFLWVHLYDPHHPFEPPEPSPLQPNRALEFFAKRAEPSEAFSRSYLATLLAGYEAEVSYTDRQLGRLLDAWDRRDGAPGSLVVLTSDHGEGLGEHMYEGHGFFLYEEQLRIPLVLRMSGRVPAAARVTAATSSVDLPATLLDLLGLPAALPGRSLRPDLEGEGSEPERMIFAERRAYSDADLERKEALQALRERVSGQPGASSGEKCALVSGDWKLVWNQTGSHELYNLRRDPREALNLVLEGTDGVDGAQALLRQVERWRRRAAQRAPVPDELDDETRSMLDALGY